MEETFELTELQPEDLETIKVDSLADLDSLIAEKFHLFVRPYSTDIRAALELVAWDLENSDAPHFELFRVEEHSLPGLPFVASFIPNGVWGYGETAPLAICQAALFRHKQIKFELSVNSYSSKQT
ncbi:hypothetical protein [Chroococcidiopsis sp.]|uniref:hypothetical protein n=1 Tax=Chroococcidiopsis sp. TaxID=3088168 RepID=UPI003F31D774